MPLEFFSLSSQLIISCYSAIWVYIAYRVIRGIVVQIAIDVIKRTSKTNTFLLCRSASLIDFCFRIVSCPDFIIMQTLFFINLHVVQISPFVPDILSEYGKCSMIMCPQESELESIRRNFCSGRIFRTAA